MCISRKTSALNFSDAKTPTHLSGWLIIVLSWTDFCELYLNLLNSNKIQIGSINLRPTKNGLEVVHYEIIYRFA